MSLGTSGRIVLEIDPDLKRDLYSWLTRDGLTMKHWFLQTARAYLEDKIPSKQHRPARASGAMNPARRASKGPK